MDSNEKSNDSEYVPTAIKAERQSDSSDPVDAVKESIYLKLSKINAAIEKKLEDIGLSQKRKNSDDSEKDMDMEESQYSTNETVKRRRYDTQTDDHSQGAVFKEKFILLVTNLPGEWTSQQVINYVKDECKSTISTINDNREEGKETDFQIRLQFETKEQLEEVYKKLKHKEAKGKLTVQIYDFKDESESGSESDSTEIILESSDTKQADSRPVSHSPCGELNLDPDEYHIKDEYLESLGIKKPITKWVTVTNFRCDKSEMKEVLELAGRVLICSISPTLVPKCAYVMYSHPLEAIQAVSMLNGQQLYGKTLNVTMNNTTENKSLLPKGLVNVGPGLGMFGKPLADLGDQYNLLVKGEQSNIDPSLFQPRFLDKVGATINRNASKFVRPSPTNSQNSQNETIDENDKQSTQKLQPIIGQIGPAGQRILDPRSNIPPIRPQTLNGPMTNHMNVRIPVPSPMQGIRGPMMGPRPISPARSTLPNPVPNFPSCPPIPGLEQGNDPKQTFLNRMPFPGQRAPVPMHPMCSPRGPMPGPNRFPGPVSPMLGPRPFGTVLHPHRPSVPVRPTHPFGPSVRAFKGSDLLTVQLTNLPPTTTFVNLGQKLGELGHVVFLELTTPGCANVRFSNAADVERCLQNYHTVLG